MGSREKNFKIKTLKKLEDANLRFTIASTVDASFKFSFVQLLYKHYIVFNFSKVTPFWRCNDPILPQFSKAPKFRVLHPHIPYPCCVLTKIIRFTIIFNMTKALSSMQCIRSNSNEMTMVRRFLQKNFTTFEGRGRKNFTRGLASRQAWLGLVRINSVPGHLSYSFLWNRFTCVTYDNQRFNSYETRAGPGRTEFWNYWGRDTPTLSYLRPCA